MDMNAYLIVFIANIMQMLKLRMKQIGYLCKMQSQQHTQVLCNNAVYLLSIRESPPKSETAMHCMWAKLKPIIKGQVNPDL